MALIGKLAGKALSKTAAKAAPKVALSLSEELAQQAVEAAPAKVPLVARKKASKALKAEEPTQTPVEAPAASEAVPEEEVMLSLSEQMAKRESLAAQTEEALPSPAAPESAYNFPNKAFSDEDYAAAEAYLKDNNTANVFNAKKLDDEAFANELQSTAAWLKGIPYKEQPPLPYKPKEFTPSEEVGADFKAKPMVDVEDVPEPQVTPEFLSGDLKSFIRTKQRNAALEDIRKYREYNYSRIKRMSDTESFDDAVIGVAQGDFRVKYGREADLSTRKDQRLMMRTLQSKQKELDSLRKKYADTPAKVLYHGNVQENIESIKKSGFARPSTFSSQHDELNVGAPSLTSDVNLNFTSNRFGGKNPENFVSYEMPYADYVFSRVNMSVDQYEKKDLNTIARSITGVPGNARPLNLPRADMFETESAMPEMDKMRRRSDVQTQTEIAEKIPQYEKFRARQKQAGENINKIVSETKGIEMSQKQALDVYRNAKEYLYAISNMGKLTSVKTGMGHSYGAAIATLQFKSPVFKRAADVLRKNNAAEKADNLESLYNLVNVSDTDTKAAGRVVDLTDKFNRGGLVSRK
jgi:hypothetical protein